MAVFFAPGKIFCMSVTSFNFLCFGNRLLMSTISRFKMLKFLIDFISDELKNGIGTVRRCTEYT